jgi:hypothetical protein
VLKRYLILFSILLILVGSVGCGNNITSTTNKASNEASASPHEHHTAQSEKVAPASSIPNKETKYTLDASIYKENDNYYLKVSTNLKLSKEHYGGPPVDGEGHIHFYLNGNLIGPIKDTNPYPLQYLNLNEGTNTIKLVLVQNNHSESFGVSKELSIEKTK